MRKYLNQKGSAMVLVLASLMILMAVGSVIVAVSAANISMSRRYSDWSAEYYWLDYAAQDQLGDLDQNVLLAAENLTREYLQSSGYQLEDVPAAYDFLQSSGIQDLIYWEWSEIYQDYQADMDSEGDPDQALSTYNEDMEELVGKAFDVVYYAYIASKNSELSGSGELTYNGASVKAERKLQNTGWFSGAATARSLDEVADSLKDLEHMPIVEIRAMEEEGEQPKQVTVLVTLVPPSFSAVQQTRYYAVKANPLYANALSVGGTITFAGGNVSVTGDVVSNNLDSEGNPLNTDEGNPNGIRAMTGARAEIYGNVYSAGDVHLMGSGSAITVNPYSGDRALKERYLYPGYEGDTTPFALDLTGIERPEQFMEGKTAENVVPYLFRDSIGGNVYCNSLAVEGGVTGGNLRVKGNLWTRDDIQNDAAGPAGITVDGRYIGLRSDAKHGDPNGSSSIINNAYMYGGTIAVGGDFIIPGTTFYKLNTRYYQTAESGTARAGEYFSIYMKNGEESGRFADYTDADGTVYSLFEGSAENPLGDKIARFRAMAAAVREVNEFTDKSGITLDSSKAGYTLGVVNGSNAVLYPGSDSTNYLTYSAASASGKFFDQVFARKTSFFGTGDSALDKLYDPDMGRSESARGFHYYKEPQILSGGMRGILFCEGNLSLTGGTYRGAVICTGNLTLSGNATVIYDEAAVRETLGLDANYRLTQKDNGGYDGSSAARRFFSPGDYSAYRSFGVEQVTMLSASAGQRAEGASRYIINSWRESKRTD